MRKTPRPLPAMPAAIADLVNAYQRATGREIRLDYMRQETLSRFAREGYTGEDVWAVVRFIKRQKRRADERGRSTYGPRALEFDRILGDPNKFDDLLQSAKADEQKRAFRGRSGPRPRTIQVAEGETVTVIDKAPTAEAKTLKENLTAGLLDLVKQLGGKN